MPRFCLPLLLSLLLTFSHGARAEGEQAVTTWIYYFNPPFIEPDAQGFAYDFVDLLNRYAVNQFQFNLEIIPRVRLNQALIRGQQGVTLFVNPSWMDPKLPRKYLWTQSLIEDRNVVISNQRYPVDYKQPQSLEGLIFGAMRGWRYRPLEPAFTEGTLFRYDVNDEAQLYRLLLESRIDVTSQPHSIAERLIKRLGLDDEVYIAAEPLYRFEYQLMVTPELPEVHAFLTHTLPLVMQTTEWQRLLEQYRLQPAQPKPAPSESNSQ